MYKFLSFILILITTSCSMIQPKRSASTYDKKARKVLLEYSPLLQDCYTQELRRTGIPLAGSVLMKIYIKQDGKVNKVKLIDDSLNSKRISKCFKTTIGKLKFPKHDKSTLIQVNQPFQFRPPN